MSLIQLKLSKDEDIMAYMVKIKHGFKTKAEAIKYIIGRFKE